MRPGDRRPIHLDTSFLIHALRADSSESDALRAWLVARRTLVMTTLAWGEFLCGPLVPEDAQVAERIVHRYRPIDVEEASLAAELFNASGRQRGSFADCVIAAGAIRDGGVLATSDRRDFEGLSPFGLELTPLL